MPTLAELLAPLQKYPVSSVPGRFFDADDIIEAVEDFTGGEGEGVTDGDKGDITVSGSGTVWTVDDAVLDSANHAFNGVPVGSDATTTEEALYELFAATPAAPTGEITDELTDEITTARDLVAADLAIGGSVDGEVKRLLVNLGTAGRFDVAKTLPKGSRFILVIDDDSELVTIGTEDDESGASVNGETTVTAQSGTQVELTVMSNAGSAPVVRAEGTIIGETREVPGPLTGDVAWGDTETASFSFALEDYNRLKKANHADTPIVGTIEQMSSVAGRSGNVVALRRVGAAAVSLAAGTGVTLAAITGHTLFARAVGSTIGAVRDPDALDTWLPVGDFAETE